ncbi:MAG: right-handed parallel beta-helix repeat-containing protein [Clostridia bacterium]|nr:right-handed parallel beta-helix repeat-containing protein [Clostridia bacterium]
MNYDAKEYGVIAGEDVSHTLQKALCELENIEGEKTLTFEKGEYHLYSNKVCTKDLFITNTVGDKQWHRGTVPHRNNIGIWIENQKDLTIDGNGAVFVMHGKMTNIAVVHSKNVKLKNFSIKVDNPDMHELKVIEVGKTHVDFEIDRESRYHKFHCRYYFVGEDYRSRFKKSTFGWWFGYIPHENENTIIRKAHPLRGAYMIKELEPHKFRAKFLQTARFRVGDRYYVYDELRKYNGIFVEKSDNVALESVNQHFNYGLAYVAQNSSNLSIEGCKFSPHADSAKLMISAADFAHICMCRGQVVIKNNEFIGAGDDTLNVHGIHFKIAKIIEDKIEVRFCHHQAHGFNPLRVGDEIAFVDVPSMLEHGRAKILSSELINETTIRLQLDDVSKAIVGEVIEDKSATPDVEFSHNFMTRIITRGVLMTSGGKVKITDNNFDNTSMHSILISDDAKSWYESGPVNDVEIARNRFGRVEGYTVQVMPENTVHNGAVHKNIYIHDNVIDNADEGWYFKSADNVVLENNTSDKPMEMKVIDADVRY